MNVKDGYKTTEFWMVALPMLAGIILIFMGDVENGKWMFGGAASGGIYAFARSNEKSTAKESTAKIEVARSEMLSEANKADAEASKLAILNQTSGTGGTP